MRTGKDYTCALNKSTPSGPISETLSHTMDTNTEHKRPKKWIGYIWDSLDKGHKERHFLFKLDLSLLSVACLG